MPLISLKKLSEDIGISINCKKYFSWQSIHAKTLVLRLKNSFYKEGAPPVFTLNFFHLYEKIYKLDNHNLFLFILTIVAYLKEDKVDTQNFFKVEFVGSLKNELIDPLKTQLIALQNTIKEELKSFTDKQAFLNYLENTPLINLNLKNQTQVIKPKEDETKLFVQNMKDLPQLFDETYYTHDDWLKKVLLLLKVLKLDALRPVISLILTKDKKNSNALFKNLSSALISRALFGCKQGENSCANLFFECENSGLKLENTLNNTLFQTARKDGVSEAFKEVLRVNEGNNNKTLIRYLLFTLELLKRDFLKEVLDNEALRYSYDLEHLMPKKFLSNWGDVLYDHTKEEVSKYVDSIGNLTLLKHGLNLRLANKSWRDKLNGKEGLYCLKNSDLLLNKDLFKIKQWDIEWIKVREEKLIKELLDQWGLRIFKS